MILFQPADGIRYRACAYFYSAVATRGMFVRLKSFHKHFIVKKQLYIIMQTALVTLEGKDIIASFFYNFCSNFLLRSHRVNGDNSAFYIEQIKQFRNSGYLVGFLIRLHLPKHDSCLARKCTHRMRRAVS